jgi:hypothetical protein
MSAHEKMEQGGAWKEASEAIDATKKWEAERLDREALFQKVERGEIPFSVYEQAMKETFPDLK